MGRARILIVDDSAVFRRALTEAFGADPDLEIVGSANNGKLALEQIERLKPDLVTLDVEMPVMDGLETVRQIRRRHRRLPILMLSTLTSEGADATLEALRCGASDYCAKPGSAGLTASPSSPQSGAHAVDMLRRDLLPRARALLRLDRETNAGAKPAPSDVSRRKARPATRRIDVVAIGCSTGGPNALSDILPRLDPSLPVPIVIVQHMPPVFTRLLAERLAGRSRIGVREAADGDRLERGRALVAPGDYHMRIERDAGGARVRLDQGPAQNFCRPAVDPLFTSVNEAYEGAVLAVILTGMGRDGTSGCDAVHRGGGRVVAQDEESSVVWGMPGSVVERGLADEILPLGRIATAIARNAALGRTAPRTPSAGSERDAALRVPARGRKP